MNLPPEGLDAYMRAIAATDAVVCPPFPYLRDIVRRATGGVSVGAQNCADQPSGAFTGEVSVEMLRDVGARYVIVGHSERRNFYGETDAMIARKLALAIEEGLTPVLCIGEDQKVRDAGRASVFVADQIKAAAVAALETAAEVIVAYEPVWAIGTGRNATADVVAEMVAGIRDALGRFWPARFAASVPVLYGGSVTPENIEDIGAHGHVDGYLVGGASLDSGRLLAIHEAFRRG